jgi:predicted N-acetyltransferase YhbS
MVDIGPVRSDTELGEILELQRKNLAASLTFDEIASHGFVTVVHTPEILRAMHALEPSIVAREGGRVVGYALVMPRETRALLPILEPMFVRMESLEALAGLRFYVMGQVCVAKSHRGKGVFDALYRGHREHLGGRFDAVVTEIATRNARSMRAHSRVGFETIETYRDATDEWTIVSWRLR